MNDDSNGIFIDLNRDENISVINLCDYKVLLGMYVKSYGFYNITLVASQNQVWNFVISVPVGLNHTAVVVTCFSSFGISLVRIKAIYVDCGSTNYLM